LTLLEQGTTYPLTILSATAGFGKTTLLAQWLAEYHHLVAWLTCETEDNEGSRFLSALIAAFQRIEPALEWTATAQLQRQPLAAWETLLPVLSHDLASLPACLLVLDDYQLITSRDLHNALDYLLSHLPPQVHVLVSSRTTPPLTLGRLRVNQQLFEIDEGDLRFNAQEIARYFSELMQRPLLDEEVKLLEQRTEGWVAGVQLASLLLQKHTSMREVLNAFTGQHRFVYRYLFEEILAHQPPEWEAFLVQTSLLSRLNASLCEAVTGQSHGQETLEALEEARLFLYPLDEERRWYRYHPLFAEMLSARLLKSRAELVPELHRRACTWYARQMLIPEAVRHALAIPDTRQALHLILPDKDALSHEVPLQTMLEWVRSRSQRTVLRAALPVLQQLLREGKAQTRPGNRLELVILLAVIHERLGEHAHAQDFLSTALEYVLLEGYRRSVVRELPLLEPLLRTSAESVPAMSVPLQSILAATNLNAFSLTQPDQLALLRERIRSGEQILSPREREVLLLLSVGASNQEIANQLIITLGTVKRHVNTILASLHVSNRTQAVARARELSLL
jgi:ATP/maltotriose-dependent transcriptional regulator MalT